MQDRNPNLRIRLPSGLLAVVILTLLLVFVVAFVPSVPLRVILGLPVLLFFPGYALLQALFVDKPRMDGLERLAISGVMSIAVVTLTGFVLNYTIWGIRLGPMLYAVAAFVMAASAVGIARRMGPSRKGRFVVELDLALPRWPAGRAGRSVSIFLVVSIVVALGAVGYVSTGLTAREPFTEFYVLGPDGRAQDYPTGFVMENGQVAAVAYGAGGDVAGQWGIVILGITNQEGVESAYSLAIRISGQPASFVYDGAVVDQVQGIRLGQGEKWERQIGFAPQLAGDGQKVEFLLSRGEESAARKSLSLWVNAREGEGP